MGQRPTGAKRGKGEGEPSGRLHADALARRRAFVVVRSLSSSVGDHGAMQAPAGLCDLCGRSGAPYTCPRCGYRYCSVQCYRCAAHMGCAEAFARDHVVGHLRGRRASPEQRRRMAAILHRVHSAHLDDPGDDDAVDAATEEEDGSDEEWSDRDAPSEHDGASADDAAASGSQDAQAGPGDAGEPPGAAQPTRRRADRFDAERAWRALTASQRARFERAVADGSLLRQLGVWQPWWPDRLACAGPAAQEPAPHRLPLHLQPLPHPSEQQEQLRLRLPAADRATADAHHDGRRHTDAASPRHAMRPEPVAGIPPLRSLLAPGTDVSPLVSGMLVECLAAYAYVARRCNGDLVSADLRDDAATMLRTVCSTLRAPTQPPAWSSLEEALTQLEAEIRRAEAPVGVYCGSNRTGVRETTVHADVDDSWRLALQVLADAAGLLADRDDCIASLSELYRVFDASPTGRAERRKLRFLLAYAADHSVCDAAKRRLLSETCARRFMAQHRLLAEHERDLAAARIAMQHARVAHRAGPLISTVSSEADASGSAAAATAAATVATSATTATAASDSPTAAATVIDAGSAAATMAAGAESAAADAAIRACTARAERAVA